MSFIVPKSTSGSSAPRKAMRKGTHSCLECRRRKTRCVFRPDESTAACVGCKTRGSQCTEQRRQIVPDAAEKNKNSLRERVAKLEALITSAGLDVRDQAEDAVQPAVEASPKNLKPFPTAQELTPAPLSTDSNLDKSIPSSLTYNTPVTSVDANSPHDIDPIVNLFNNAIWRRTSLEGNDDRGLRDDSIPGMSTGSGDPHAAVKIIVKRSSTRELLLSALPASELLWEILNATSSWWNTWRQLGPWISDSLSRKPETLQEFILWGFDSDNPPVVGLALLCVAVSLQLLDAQSHAKIILRLRSSPEELWREYFDLVDQLIVNDSEYACSREGIEVMLFSGKIMMNMGLIKKCWVLNHRAGSYAQILGFHRGQRLRSTETETQRALRHKAWLSLCQADVLLSLLLGLPYAFDGRTIPMSSIGDIGTTEYFKNKIMGPSTRVIDRNQMGLSLSVQLTNEIQKELDNLAAEMHQDFWDPSLALAKGAITEGEYAEQISAHFKYQLLRLFIHMPLMIQSVEDSRLENHRAACLDACRDALKVYHIMHSESSSAFNLIKLIDYEAFICSSLLILGLMGYGLFPQTEEVTDRNEDMELVQLTLSVLRGVSSSSNNTASQAVQGLETLMNLVSGKLCPPAGENSNCARIVVPYTGTITITAGRFFTGQTTSTKSCSESAPPLFTLSDVEYQLPASQSRVHSSINGSSEIAGSGMGMESQDNFGLEYPSIELDWAGLMNMNTEADWTWLNADANARNGNLWSI